MGHGWCRMIKGWGSGWACGAGTIALWRIKVDTFCAVAARLSRIPLSRAPWAWNPAACRLQHTSAPTARTVSPRARDRDHFTTSNHALRLPAPLLIDPLASCIFFRPQQTRCDPRPASPPIGKLPALPQDTQHNVDPTTSHGPGHDPRHQEDSQAQGLWYAARRLRRPPPPPNSPPRWPRTDRDGAPQTQTTRTTRPSTRPTEATSSKGRRDL